MERRTVQKVGLASWDPHGIKCGSKEQVDGAINNDVHNFDVPKSRLNHYRTSSRSRCDG